jgi:hypothetical protein
MSDHDNLCPLAAIDRRLSDAHRQWHQAEQAYFEPEAFRLAIQSAIQTLRTVTFMLQSNKRIIPDFQPWYQEWQDRLRADPLMRWMVDARNRIEKQGDLEMHSFVRAEIIASHLDEGPRQEVAADLFQGPEALLQSLPADAAGEHVMEHGILAIQRRWIENTLPDHELLDAVAIAYGRLSELVASAHEQMGLDRPQTTDQSTGQMFQSGDRQGRLPCMIGHAETRTLNISLADGSTLTLENHKIEFDIEKAKVAAERFPVDPSTIFADKGASLDSQLNSLFQTARQVFLASGYHDTIVFLFANGVPIEIRQLRPEEHNQKYLMMRGLATEVIRHGADAVIMISEVWSAPFDRANPYRRAADAPDRVELLTASLVRKEGDPAELFAEIKRAGDQVSLGDTIQVENPALFAFSSIYEAWSRPVPEEWAASFFTADGVRPA